MFRERDLPVSTGEFDGALHAIGTTLDVGLSRKMDFIIASTSPRTPGSW